MTLTRKEIISIRKDVVYFIRSKHSLSNAAVANILNYGITKEGVRKILQAKPMSKVKAKS